MCALGLAGCVGCAVGSAVEPPARPVATVAKPTEKPAPPPPTLICRWIRQVNVDGVSILKGTPKDKTLDELAAGALVYDAATKGRIQCRRLKEDDAEDSESNRPVNPNPPREKDAPVEVNYH